MTTSTEAQTNTMPALPDDLFWRVSKYTETEYTRGYGFELGTTVTHQPDWLFKVSLCRKPVGEPKYENVTTEEPVERVGMFGKRYTTIKETTVRKKVDPEAKVLMSTTMADVKYGEDQPEEGYITVKGENINDRHWSYLTYYDSEVLWFLPDVLSDEAVAKRAKQCWESYIDQQYGRALDEDARFNTEVEMKRVLRASNNNIDRLLGDYPPNRLN